MQAEVQPERERARRSMRGEVTASELNAGWHNLQGVGGLVVV